MATRDEFYSALRFMTRLPVPDTVEHSDESFARSARFYPAVGLVVGDIAGISYYLLGMIFPENVATFLCIIIAVGLTGALHEDGLADTVDGLFGGKDRDSMLAIMRDSHVGVFGMIAVFFVVALKWSALFEWPSWSVVWVVVAGHVISRHAIVEIIARYDYARAESAKFSRPAVADDDLTYARLWTLGVVVAALFLVGITETLIGIALAVVAVMVLSRAFVRKIGGYTGDCLGATQQVAEVAFLLGVVAWL